MAFVAKMRNRIIGLLIIVTLIIIILPALMSSQGRGSRKNSELIAITREGAVTDEDGQLMPAQEPDYATLLDPVDDLSGSDPSSAAGAESAQSSPAQRTGAETLSAGTAARPRPAETLTAPARSSARPPAPAAAPAPGTGAASEQRPQQQGRYTVQVGAFSAADRADKLVGQLKAKGIAATVQRDRRDHKEVFRVCAGNAQSRKDLEALLRKIELAVNIQGIIVER